MKLEFLLPSNIFFMGELFDLLKWDYDATWDNEVLENYLFRLFYWLLSFWNLTEFVKGFDLVLFEVSCFYYIIL